jgi:lipopolysaccharide biosynthesis glycosyltransferase
MQKLSTSKEIIPIFFAVDDFYSPYLCVSLESLIENGSDQYHYDINILIEELSEENKQNILEMQRDNLTISFVSVAEKLRAICRKLHLRDYYTKATYYRFFIPELFPDLSKGLYLDCDIVITTDIAELYHTELGDNYIAAIPEEFITDVEVFGIYSEKVLGVPRQEYFNAGILVMNLDIMRRDNLQAQFAELLEKVIYRVAQDQDYLNVICYGKTVILDKTWNRTPMPYADRSVTPKIAHYKINFKPWKFDGIPFGELFWQYAENTPHYNRLWDAKENYGEENKLRDKKQYEQLVRLALSEIDEKEREQEIFDNAMLFAVT